MKTVTLLGEVMLEIAPERNADLYRLGVAGDSYNTAIALAQLGCKAEYLTGLGTDTASQRILDHCRQWQVGHSLVQHLDHSSPGLYLIQTDQQGERSFSYWREQSAARRIFHDPSLLEHALDTIEPGQWLFYSGITLAIASPECRQQLQGFFTHYRARGGEVIFDINHRPALWQDVEQARHSYQTAIDNCDLFLPGQDDLTALWPEAQSDCERFLRSLKPKRQLLKTGGEALVIIERGQTRRMPLHKLAKVVDTTGAGDSFNGGLIAALNQGISLNAAAAFAHQLASATVMSPGAILPSEQWPTLRENLAALSSKAQ